MPEILHRKGISKTNKYLLILALQKEPITSKMLRLIAQESGWKDGANSVPSTFLEKSGCAINLPTGWIINEAGKRKLNDANLFEIPSILTPIEIALDGYIVIAQAPVG